MQRIEGSTTHRLRALIADDTRHVRTHAGPPSATIGVGLLLGAASVGFAASRGYGPILVAVALVGGLAVLAANTRWAAAFALAPVLIYPVQVVQGASLAGFPLSSLLAAYSLTIVGVYALVRRNRSYPSPYLVAAIIICALASLVETLVRGDLHALGQYAPQLTIFAFGTAAVLLGVFIGDDTRQLGALGLLCAPLAAFAVFQVATGNTAFDDAIGNFYKGALYDQGLARATSTFGHPLVAGASLTLVALAAFVSRDRLLVALVPLLLLGAALTASRTAFLGMAAGIVLVMVKRDKRRWVAGATIVGVVGALLVALVLLPDFTTSVKGRVLSQPYKQVGRSEGPSVVVGRVVNHPTSIIIGPGLGGTARDLTASGGVGGFVTYDNQYVTAVLDFGLVLVILIAFLLARAFQTASPSTRGPFVPALGAGLTMMVFFDGLVWPSFAMLFWFVFGAATRRPSRGSSNVGDASRRH